MPSNPIVISLWLTLILMGLHYAAPYMRRIPFIPEPCLASFSGGFAVSFVFLHMLPGLAEQKETLGRLLAKQVTITPLLDLMVYVVGLLGFMIFFALEKVVQKQKARSAKMGASNFYLHLILLAVYNGLITYTLPLRVEAGLVFSLIFTFAIGLHFVIGDRFIEEHYPKRFYTQGRIILLSVLLLAWCLAVWMEPKALVVALLTSFLGGAILLNVFRNEIPQSGQSHFGFFIAGTTFGTLLLILVTYLEKGHG